MEICFEKQGCGGLFTEK